MSYERRSFADMKSRSGIRDVTPLRHQDVRSESDDVTSQCDGSPTAEAHEIVERGRTRIMVSKFEVGSKVNVCGSRSRTFDKAYVESKVYAIHYRHR